MNLLLAQNPIHKEHMEQKSFSWITSYKKYSDGVSMNFNYPYPVFWHIDVKDSKQKPEKVLMLL